MIRYTLKDLLRLGLKLVAPIVDAYRAERWPGPIPRPWEFWQGPLEVTAEYVLTWAGFPPAHPGFVFPSWAELKEIESPRVTTDDDEARRADSWARLLETTTFDPNGTEDLGPAERLESGPEVDADADSCPPSPEEAAEEAPGPPGAPETLYTASGTGKGRRYSPASDTAVGLKYRRVGTGKRVRYVPEDQKTAVPGSERGPN